MDMDTTKNTARTLWYRVEPVHAVTYFAPESHAAFEAPGPRGALRAGIDLPRAPNSSRTAAGRTGSGRMRANASLGAVR
ncbi:hypothetical protein ACF08N_29770 [Streptomyces sp. NPDC015127]|uniref:helix-turn-helix domain-containing protein n=1 Tax=Streptomyces sp. NPDC015127 TaxID=3364939 RepID=UPI00370019C8